MITHDSITLSEQQATALDEIERWHARRDGDPFFLSGYAGTGKTTLASEIARRAGGALFASFTGKAASVMPKNANT